MRPEHYIGKTLEELAQQTGQFGKPIRIFALDSKEDDTGKWLMDAYRIRQVIIALPALATAEVVYASNYYGETILRVKA